MAALKKLVQIRLELLKKDQFRKQQKQLVIQLVTKLTVKIGAENMEFDREIPPEKRKEIIDEHRLMSYINRIEYQKIINLLVNTATNHLNLK